MYLRWPWPRRASANRPRAVAINVDAHFDLRADAVRNSGTPYRQILDEGILPAGQFYEMGYQPFANSPAYEKYAQDKGVNLHDVNELRVRGVETSTHHILSGASTDAWMFWGFDMDVVRSADAPGVSAPNPTGLTSDEFCQIAAIAGADKRTRLMEFSECNPDYDSDGRTARLAAIAIWYALAGIAKLRGNYPNAPFTTNATLDGRSASRRMKYGYQCVPYGM